MPNFSKKHPETRDDEIFLTNCADDSNIGWKTKRAGNTAYNIYGIPLPANMFPVFVTIQEMVDAGFGDRIDYENKCLKRN